MSAERYPKNLRGVGQEPNQRPSITSPYLTAHEAIVYLRLTSQSALYHLVREHGLPHCRRGRLYLFDMRELDAWVHGHDSAIEYARAQRRSA